MDQNDAFFSETGFYESVAFFCLQCFFQLTINRYRNKRKGHWQRRVAKKGKGFKMRMIQEIVNFVDPDPTVEFDPASRVSGHASLKCAASLLSLFRGSSPSLQRFPPSLVISFSLIPSISLLRALSVVLGVSFTRRKQKKQVDQFGAGNEGRARRRRRKRRNVSWSEEKPSAAGGTKREKWRRDGGWKGEGIAREKEAMRWATKVAVTLYKASKPNDRGPKGKKTRRSALRGDAEGNEGVHKEEARMDEGRRWQGCKVEAVVPRASSALRINGDASRKLTKRNREDTIS